MKDKKQITQFMLELYHLNAVTNKERKIIEETLANDNDVRTRYEELKRLDKEIKSKHGIDTPPVFTVIKSNKIKTNKILIGVGIAAVFLCLCIPAFLYLNNSKKGTGAEITENNIEQNISNEERQIIVLDNNENEQIVIKPSEKKEPNKNNNVINEKENIYIAEVPNTEQGVQTRGGNNVNENNVTSVRATDEFYQKLTDIEIPIGMTFIFENMFANMDYREITIPEGITKIGKNAFLNNPLISVTIGTNVTIDENAIPGNFAYVYENNGKTAGIYERKNYRSDWEKK